MILTHPDNLKLFEDCQAIAKEGGCAHPFLPIDGIEIRTDRLIEPTRKTGRLIWPKDPFVTYEESDRSWGLALGIAQEETEPLFYEMPDVRFEPISAQIDNYFNGALERLQQDLAKSWAIPQRILMSPTW